MSLGGYVLALFVIVPLVGLILLRLREFRKEKAAAEASAAADPAGLGGQDRTTGQLLRARQGRGRAAPTPSRPGSHRRGSAPR